jgi:hypothetical protein
LPKTSSVQLMLHAGTHEAPHRVGRVVVREGWRLVRSRERYGQWMERAGVRDALMRPVRVVEPCAVPKTQCKV